MDKIVKKLNQAFRNYNNEKYDEAISNLEDVIAIGNDESKAYAYNNIGLIQYKQGDFSKSIDSYKSSIGYMDNYETPFNLGLSYLKIHNLADAKSCFEKSIEINQNYRKAYYKLAEVDEKLKKV